MNQTIKHFTEQLIKGQYKAAAQIYFNRAYQYREAFNRKLEKLGVKDEVIEELRNLECYGEYNDQI
tara:strand:+ start:282 stop:479 length:198 start_codon:yes stop_codon:yes gene_type:complete